MTGTNRQFSERLLAAESANVATFIDYRRTFPETEPGDVAALQAHFAHIHALSLKWQVAFEADDFERIELHSNAISDHLVEIQAGLSQIDPELGAAVAELRDVWDRPVLGPDDVRQMPKFGALFGRETVYLSLTRPLGSHAIAAGAPDSGA